MLTLRTFYMYTKTHLIFNHFLDGCLGDVLWMFDLQIDQNQSEFNQKVRDARYDLKYIIYNIHYITSNVCFHPRALCSQGSVSSVPKGYWTLVLVFFSCS